MIRMRRKDYRLRRDRRVSLSIHAFFVLIVIVLLTVFGRSLEQLHDAMLQRSQQRAHNAVASVAQEIRHAMDRRYDEMRFLREAVLLAAGGRWVSDPAAARLVERFRLSHAGALTVWMLDPSGKTLLCSSRQPCPATPPSVSAYASGPPGNSTAMPVSTPGAQDWVFPMGLDVMGGQGVTGRLVVVWNIIVQHELDKPEAARVELLDTASGQVIWRDHAGGATAAALTGVPGRAARPAQASHTVPGFPWTVRVRWQDTVAQKAFAAEMRFRIVWLVWVLVLVVLVDMLVQWFVRRVNRLREYQAAALRIQQELLALEDEQQIFQRVTDLVVSETEAIAAYVVVRQPDNDRLLPVAASADQEALREALMQLMPSLDPALQPQGGLLPSIAIRERRVVGPQDPRAVAAMRAIQQEHPALLRVRSVMVYPVFLPEQTEASLALVIESASARHFTQAVRQLLQQLALSIGITLSHIRHHREIAEANAFNTSLFDTVGAIIMVMNTDGEIVRMNGACERFMHITSAEVAGQPYYWQRFIPEDERGGVRAMFDQIVNHAMPRHIENHWVTPDGQKRLFHWINTIVDDAHGQAEYLVTVGMDVTEQKNLEQALQDNLQRTRRLSDFNLLMAQVNHSIAMASDEEQLLRDICDLAVRHAHFSLALIARPGEDKRFRFPAASGELAYLQDLFISTDPEIAEGRGGFATVWRSQRPLFNDRALEVAYTLPWRERFRALGFHSNAVLPIMRNGSIWGIFALYHAERDVFNQDLRAILEELALDISRGLDHLATQNLQRVLLNNSVTAIFLVRNRIIQLANARASEMFGFAFGEMEGIETRRLYMDEAQWQETGSQYDGILRGQEVKIASVYMRHKQGKQLITDISGILVDPEEKLSVWTVEDVTQRELQRLRLQRLSDFKALLSDGNEAIARAESEAALLQTMCDLAIVRARMRLVWIGAPDGSGVFIYLAAAGATAYLEGLQLSADVEAVTGSGAAGRCWRSGQPVFNLLPANEPQLQSLVARMRSFDIGAMAAVPIMRSDRLWGVMAVYHNEADVFDAELQSILVDLAQDIGLGLDRLDSTSREREANAFNMALLDSMTSGITVVRYPERIVERVNARMLEMFGATTVEQVVGHSSEPLFASKAMYRHVGRLAATVLREGHGLLRDVAYRRMDDSILYVDLSGQMLIAADGVQRIIWTLVDVTERRRSEQTIRALSNSRAILLANTTAGIDLVRYPDRVFVEVNQGFLNLLGYERPEEVVGHGTYEIYEQMFDAERMKALSEQVFADGQASLRDLRVKRKDGEIRYLDVSGQLLPDGDHGYPVIVWTSIDVTERRHLTEELARQAMFDKLTGLPNRRALDEEFVKALLRTRRALNLMAVVMMDLDGFKPVNDIYGHEAGDLVLRTIGQRLQDILRRTDFLARLGGDEFVLLIEDCDNLDEVTTVMDKVWDAITAPIDLGNNQAVSIEASAGVCIYPFSDVDNPDMLMRYADQALYENKKHKLDRQRFWTVYGEATPQRLNMYQRLLREGRLEVHYQPVLDNHSRRFIGIEALARLRNDDNHMLHPQEFLPALCSDELFDMSRRVLDTALRDLRSLDADGPGGLWVSVNIDPGNITAHCVHCLQEIVETSEIDTQRIHFEIFEGSHFDTQHAGMEYLYVLRQQGIRFVLDDVGSAYSSLLRLKELPIDKIKLDQDFVRTLDQHPRELQFVESILDLANGLGLELMVEGVENDDILDAMTVLGVPSLQGYGIAYPMAFAQLREFLQLPFTRHRHHPVSLLGVYARQLASHSTMRKAIVQNPHLVDAKKIIDAGQCPIHDDLVRLGVDESHEIHRLHQAYHRSIGDMHAQYIASGNEPDWAALRKSQRALLDAIMEVYQTRAAQAPGLGDRLPLICQ